MIYRKKNLQSENMVTIKLCHHLLLDNIEFDVEYDPDWGMGKKKIRERSAKGERGSRFDLIIVKGDQILAVVECKKRSTATAKNQLNRYSKYGVPVLLCNGLDKIDSIFQECRKLYFGNPPCNHL